MIIKSKFMSNQLTIFNAFKASSSSVYSDELVFVMTIKLDRLVTKTITLHLYSLKFQLKSNQVLLIFFSNNKI